MFDADMCIYLMNDHPVEVARRFARCYVGEVVISAITLAELEYGIACSGTDRERKQEALGALLEDIPAAPFDERAARAYGPIRAVTRDRTRDALDKLIAAHAVSLDVAPVTNSEADFAGYPGLKSENWARV
jgi:tRNA(fMet)-specific endonuclease VapC